LARLETWMLHFGLSNYRVAIIRRRLPEIADSGVGFIINEDNNLF